MAKIVDPDQLNQATEVVFDTGAKTIQLLVAGNLDDNAPGKTSGVTFQALYSFAKEEWLSDSALNKLLFPILAIFEAKFEFINGWAPKDAQTRDLLRDGGWKENLTGAEYASMISLGSMDDPGSDLAYYQHIVGFDQSTIAFDKTGELNEPIQIWDGGANDYRGFLKVFLREEAKTYALSNLILDQDLTALTYQAYRLPLANATDIKVTHADAFIDANTPYTGMSISYLKGSGFTTWANSTVYPAGAVVLDAIRQSGGSSNGTWWFTPAGGTSNGTGTADDTGVTDWESYAGEVQIGTEWFAFNRIIAGNNGTAEEIYEYAQRQLRQTGDINDNLLGSPNQNAFGTINGNIASELLFFVGDTLTSRGGVYISGFNVNDQNRLTFFDITVDGGGLDSEFVPVTSTARTYPFVSAFDLVFSSNLVAEADVDTLFRMYFNRTKRLTGTDVAVTAASGNTATLTSSTTDLSLWTTGNYLRIGGFSNGVNNGIFRATSPGTTTSLAIEKPYQPGDTLINEGAGPTVTLDDDPFDTPDAVVVNDDTPAPIQGQITGATISKTFDYDGNVQGGRAAGNDANVTVVAQGLGLATWVSATFTITRATGLQFPVNAADERNYSNP